MKIGWIGTGVMGASMAKHLQDAGHEIFVYNRTKSKTDNLVATGAITAKQHSRLQSPQRYYLALLAIPMMWRRSIFLNKEFSMQKKYHAL